MSYKIGKFEFSSKEEYDLALKELQLIKKIRENYDVNNPKIASALLRTIKKGDKIKFHTRIGDAFIRLLEKKSQVRDNDTKQLPIKQDYAKTVTVDNEDAEDKSNEDNKNYHFFLRAILWFGMALLVGFIIDVICYIFEFMSDFMGLFVFLDAIICFPNSFFNFVLGIISLFCKNKSYEELRVIVFAVLAVIVSIGLVFVSGYFILGWPLTIKIVANSLRQLVSKNNDNNDLDKEKNRKKTFNNINVTEVKEISLADYEKRNGEWKE